jgi:hypothetical protein
MNSAQQSKHAYVIEVSCIRITLMVSPPQPPISHRGIAFPGKIVAAVEANLMESLAICDVSGNRKILPFAQLPNILIRICGTATS